MFGDKSWTITTAGTLLSGALVGFGTSMGSGCTSGHGVCGLPRLSPRSWIAVATFMTTGVLTAMAVGSTPALTTLVRGDSTSGLRTLAQIEVPHAQTIVAALGAALLAYSLTLAGHIDVPGVTATTVPSSATGSATTTTTTTAETAALVKKTDDPAAVSGSSSSSTTPHHHDDHHRHHHHRHEELHAKTATVPSILTSFAMGAMFSAGLGLSSMTRPEKVISFLDILHPAGWDPSLAFVIGGAMLLNLVTFPLIFKRGTPLLGKKFHVPTAREITSPLVVGAALFGVGWGVGGMCPGPGLVTLAHGGAHSWAWVAAMSIGMGLHRLAAPMLARIGL